MSRLAGQTEHSRLAAAFRATLAQHPHALVAAIDREGLFVDMPDTVQITNHQQAFAGSALDLVRPADRDAVISAWERAKSEGAARASVVLGTEAAPIAWMYFFDVIPEHGVFIGIVAATDSSH
jgi:hypothetical protein